MSEVTQSAETPTVEVEKAVSGANIDYANLPTDKLLASFWVMMQSPVADLAVQAVNLLGERQAAPMVAGDLATLVQTAAGLKKAYGRSITPEVVGNDLRIEIPDGFHPTFALYLTAAKLRPDDANERKTITAVKAAIRRKITALRHQ